MNVGRSAIWRRLAIAAAKKADLAVDQSQGEQLAAEQVACTTDGLAARDAAWSDYETRLRDTRSYSLKEIQAWLAKEYNVKVDMTGVWRDRERLSAKERVNQLVNDKLKSAVETVGKLDPDQLYAGGLQYIMQLMFSTLLNYSPDRLDEMSNKEVIGMMETFAKAGKLMAEKQQRQSIADLNRLREAELKKNLDQQLSALKGAPAAELTAEKIEQIRRAVFGG